MGKIPDDPGGPREITRVLLTGGEVGAREEG